VRELISQLCAFVEGQPQWCYVVAERVIRPIVSTADQGVGDRDAERLGCAAIQSVGELIEKP
jgi:hypothetical protein